MEALLEEWHARKTRTAKLEKAKDGSIVYAEPGGTELEFSDGVLTILYGLKPNYNAPLKDTPKLRALLAQETKDQAKLLKKATLDAAILAKRHLMEPGKSLGVKPVLELCVWKVIVPKDAKDIDDQIAALITTSRSWSKKRGSAFFAALAK